jgi:hypothetical protein
MSATVAAVTPLVFVVSPVKSDWQTGFDLYLAGKGESACANLAQTAGWWAALDAEAACNVCDRMASDGKSGAEMDRVLDDCQSFDDWRYGK